MNPSHHRARSVVAVILALALAGCATTTSVKWPWKKAPPAAPEPASEFVLTATDGGAAPAYPQFWKRNAVLVDLQSAGSSGSFEMRPREGLEWPVRVAFRVRPGAIEALDVRGDQRVILTVTHEGAQPVEIELAPGVYGPKTRALVVSWGTAQSPSGAR